MTEATVVDTALKKRSANISLPCSKNIRNICACLILIFFQEVNQTQGTKLSPDLFVATVNMDINIFLSCPSARNSSIVICHLLNSRNFSSLWTYYPRRAASAHFCVFLIFLYVCQPMLSIYITQFWLFGFFFSFFILHQSYVFCHYKINFIK